MRKQDLGFLLFIILLFLPFFLFDPVFRAYEIFNKSHPLITSFIKFAILATSGELIGLRIQTGKYFKKGFGVLPRALVWGLLGITIQIAFIIFSNGTKAFAMQMGMDVSGTSLGNRILVALFISTALNLVYAPVMMTLHKITDTHILLKGGTLKGFFSPIDFAGIFRQLDWYTQWNFIFKKSIPFFWIPAHTITFLLPPEYRVLFAALLGIMLGIILSVGNLRKNTSKSS